MRVRRDQRPWAPESPHAERAHRKIGLGASATPKPREPHARERDDEADKPSNRGALRDYVPVVVGDERILGGVLLYLLSIHTASLRERAHCVLDAEFASEWTRGDGELAPNDERRDPRAPARSYGGPSSVAYGLLPFGGFVVGLQLAGMWIWIWPPTLPATL